MFYLFSTSNVTLSVDLVVLCFSETFRTDCIPAFSLVSTGEPNPMGSGAWNFRSVGSKSGCLCGRGKKPFSVVFLLPC